MKTRFFDLLGVTVFLSLILAAVPSASARGVHHPQQSELGDATLAIGVSTRAPSSSRGGRHLVAAPTKSSTPGARIRISESENGTTTLSIARALQESGTTTRVSVASDGIEGNGGSANPSISSDGRYVAFLSNASNLVSGDTNGVSDVFVHDRETGSTTRVSVASDGTQGNLHSQGGLSISADGRYVAFSSYAWTLVPNDSMNSIVDAFVHDCETGSTTRVSVSSDGTPGNKNSWVGSISADARYVLFHSSSSNLVSGDTNGVGDAFVHDRETGQTTRVSVASDGSQANGSSGSWSISADGRYVAFTSWASNLVSDDTNGESDVFVHDRQTGETTRVSVASDGAEGDSYSQGPAISADGRYVAFWSLASNLVSDDTNGERDVFVHDRQTDETSRVSVAADGTEGNGESRDSSISGDGRYVAFWSRASNLVSDDTNGERDVFVHDRQMDRTTRVSVASDGTEADSGSLHSAVAANGGYVAFSSDAANLVPDDTNGVTDVFVHDQGSTDSPPRQHNGPDRDRWWWFW